MPDGVFNNMEAVAALEPDAELMLRLKAGDSASFDLLLARYRGPVIHFLYRMVQNAAVAEELAQEVFLRVYRARASYVASAKFTTWLFRIALHLALNNRRDAREQRESSGLDDLQVADRGPSAEQSLVQAARLAEIRAAIQALPDKQRAAVLMHKYEEMGYAQIAEVLGCSESAVKSLLFRAYETLRARLAHMG